MQRPFVVVVVAIVMCGGLALGAAAVAETPAAGTGVGLSFSCNKEEKSGKTICVCQGLLDCVNMAQGPNCKADSPDKEDDLKCLVDSEGEPDGICSCTQGGSVPLRPDRGQRPDSFSPATEAAPGEPVVRDHRRPRQDNAATQNAPTTTVRDHRNKGPQNPPGLLVPTFVEISDITGTTVTLSWQDNSSREYGVAVERLEPVAARRDPAHGWKQVATFEERVQSRVAGTGRRSDEDFDLTPDTDYCYRMRAYFGFSMSEASGYSEVVCAKTSGSSSPVRQCSRESTALCERNRATCDVVLSVSQSSSEVCRWGAADSEQLCSRTRGIWTAAESRYGQNHPDAVPRGKAGACLSEVANLRGATN